MIPKGTTKFIKSLQLKKYRKAEQCFLVEGEKSVSELLNSDFEIRLLACTQAFLDHHTQSADKCKELHVTTEKYLVAAGTLQTNQHALAVAQMKRAKLPEMVNEFGVVLDNIKDPGNLGTIIRICDWYGIRHIVASETTTDMFAPKVINATMGSFCRVHVHYTSLEQYLQKNTLPVYGAMLDGTSVYDTVWATEGLILIGSESHGISESIRSHISHRITIPKYGNAESLNAAVATAVVLDNMRRSS